MVRNTGHDDWMSREIKTRYSGLRFQSSYMRIVTVYTLVDVICLPSPLITNIYRLAAFDIFPKRRWSDE